MKCCSLKVSDHPFMDFVISAGLLASFFFFLVLKMLWLIEELKTGRLINQIQANNMYFLFSSIFLIVIFSKRQVYQQYLL